MRIKPMKVVHSSLRSLRCIECIFCRFNQYLYRVTPQKLSVCPYRSISSSNQPQPSVKMSQFKYPIVRRNEDFVEDYFGTKVPDPYRWLEDPDSDETKAFIKVQNDLTKPFLESCPHRSDIREAITNLWDYPKQSCPSKRGYQYYQFRNTGLQNQDVLYLMQDLDSGKEHVFLDPNSLSEDGTVALSRTCFTEDGSTMAYSLSTSGSDWVQIKFRDTFSGIDYVDSLVKVKHAHMTWMHDHKGFIYSAYLSQTGKTDGSETDVNENHRIYYHKLGSEQCNDILIAQFDDPHLVLGATVSDCGNYIIVTASKSCKNNMVYFSCLNNSMEIKSKLILQPVIDELIADFEYITNVGSTFYFLTNYNASNYKIIAIDFNNPIRSNWTDFIEEHPKDVLEWVRCINNDHFVLCYVQDVKHVMYIYDGTGKKVHDILLDVGTVTSISGKKEHKRMFFSFYSFLTPQIIYMVDFCDDGQIKQSIYHQAKVGNFDSSNYETRQVFYEAKDSTKIPMFIVHKKGLVLDGTKPCLLCAYGGFSVSVMPSFSVSRIIFIRNFEGVYALANVRGGGEYGQKWHDAGRFRCKQNTFDDFQYAAKYLIKNNYTTASKITTQGGSNGGLTVQACANQAPHLYRAVICQVGVLDMLRYHKFTLGYAWKSDYDCSDKEEDFHYLLKYSPLHNIRVPSDSSQEYPATLLLTADHDDRVVPLHSYKFIAQLQHTIGSLPQQKNPLMIRIDTQAGHGAGKPTSKIIDELTDIFCFISKTVGLPFHSSA